MTSDRWDDLAATTAGSHGISRLRVAPSSAHELHIGVVQPEGRRCLWYEVATAAVPEAYGLPKLRSIHTTICPIADNGSRTLIELSLENPDLSDVFKAMVRDLVRTIAATADDDSGLEALSHRAQRWRRLLETDGAGGLVATDRRGLVGELLVLRELLDAGGSALVTITTWTGPAGQHQDFQAAQAAIEVKATITKQPQSLIITSERELDRTGIPHLYLVHVSLDERQGGAGSSLNDLVVEIRTRLSGNVAASAVFDDGLLQYGYLTEQAALYESTKYTVREQNVFEVVDGFPCITETMVPTGVGDVTYRVQLAALQAFGVPFADAMNRTVGI